MSMMQMRSIMSTAAVAAAILLLLAICSTTTAFVVVTKQQSLKYTSSTAFDMSSSPAAPKNRFKKVFVAGGTRGVGRCIVDQLRKRDGVTEVVVLARDESTADELNEFDRVTAIVGNALDQKTVENAMDGCDAAITTLGGSVADDDSQRVDYIGNNNVIESAGILGITRIILITSVGCGSSRDAAPPAVFEQLKPVLTAKERAENVLIKYYTNSEWTIIRPGGLKSEPATGQAILTEDTTAIGSIHREDVAALAIQAMESPSTTRKILTAIDPSITSAVNVDGKQVKAFALV